MLLFTAAVQIDMPILEIRHPLIRHKIGLMRRADISTKNFRELSQEIASLLTYEATKDLILENEVIEGWAGSVSVERILAKKLPLCPFCVRGLACWKVCST